ncbi:MULTISPECIES: 4Fe-4S dicluster domain-containing protein [Paraburkholderia]|uniref:4Fe-4S dicluster domain-containing protein n=1 Tax=Paraburkholderia TaxID=1822464 RepID=UPI000B3FD09D
MTCVVTDRCINCRYGDCLDACPVNAFRVGPNYVVIDPLVCVNCTTCVISCPIGAIVPDYELSREQRYLAGENARLARIFPHASEPVEALPDADEWSMRTDKRSLIKES